ncbi:sensor histidine kinase [Chungangia koreensis]|uniref:histidine kinase n=2 Tax=Chungangia koreensis TaxID=752657 RepID=A0ABV8X5K6_9LACT
MRNWFHIFPKQTGLSVYVWIIFCILPFYFIFKSSKSPIEITIGIIMILLFLVFYRFSFMYKGWPLYVFGALQIILCVAMTILFGYIYFSLFLALFIGNIQNKAGFTTLYTIHLAATIASLNLGFFFQTEIFLTQLPFILICVIGVILLPLTSYNRNKQEVLEVKLEDANKRIAELVKIEERQRIARDLHDILGQKLSLIGLKSDLAYKLVDRDTTSAKNELNDIRQTARFALSEVRDIVSKMRGTKLEDEIIRVRQILKAAEIDSTFKGMDTIMGLQIILENVLSMCLKEAVNNVVRHSKATSCDVTFEMVDSELIMRIKDDGIGIDEKQFNAGNGLKGMRERLDFINGTLDLQSSGGTLLTIKVPTVSIPDEEEDNR